MLNFRLKKSKMQLKAANSINNCDFLVKFALQKLAVASRRTVC